MRLARLDLQVHMWKWQNWGHSSVGVFMKEPWPQKRTVGSTHKMVWIYNEYEYRHCLPAINCFMCYPDDYLICIVLYCCLICSTNYEWHLFRCWTYPYTFSLLLPSTFCFFGTRDKLLAKITWNSSDINLNFTPKLCWTTPQFSCKNHCVSLEADPLLSVCSFH